MYQDHLTKVCVLRPVKSKRFTEVAAQIMDIFPLLGAPAILQSDNGHVISEIRLLACLSQGSVERANGDIKDVFVAWLADNDTHDWITGITLVQFQFRDKAFSTLSSVW